MHFKLVAIYSKKNVRYDDFWNKLKHGRHYSRRRRTLFKLISAYFIRTSIEILKF